MSLLNLAFRNLIPVAIRDRIAAVASEILSAYFHTRRRLATFIFSDVEQILDALDVFFCMSPREDLLYGKFQLDQAEQ